MLQLLTTTNYPGPRKWFFWNLLRKGDTQKQPQASCTRVSFTNQFNFQSLISAEKSGHAKEYSANFELTEDYYQNVRKLENKHVLHIRPG
jgi:hypothetical protein